MKVSREQMAENRRRILEAAGSLFKEKGFEAVSVAEVMKAAGLTHGGFYGHFRSKDDLVAQALAHALAAESFDDGGFNDFVRYYLAPRHRDNPGNGCPTAGLAAALRHQTPEAKAAMTQGLRAQIARIEQALPVLPKGDKRTAAIGSWAAMIGAVILARAVDDPQLSDEVLTQTRAWIEACVG